MLAHTGSAIVSDDAGVVVGFVVCEKVTVLNRHVHFYVFYSISDHFYV